MMITMLGASTMKVEAASKKPTLYKTQKAFTKVWNAKWENEKEKLREQRDLVVSWCSANPGQKYGTETINASGKKKIRYKTTNKKGKKVTKTYTIKYTIKGKQGDKTDLVYKAKTPWGTYKATYKFTIKYPD